MNINFKAIRSHVFAATVLGALAVGGLGATGHAQARVNDTDHGDLADLCAAVQAGYDSAHDKYQAATTAADKKKYAGQMNDAIDQWWRIGCGDEFDSIIDMPRATLTGTEQVGGGTSKSINSPPTAPKPGAPVAGARGISSH